MIREYQDKKPKSGKGETVLIAEDEENVLELASRILRDSGYNVISAKNGEEAYWLAENYDKQIDLLLTDVIMPKLSGKDLCEKIVKQRPDIKILFMSGYTEKAIINHGVIPSDSMFLSKPFSVLSITSKVREALDSKQIF